MSPFIFTPVSSSEYKIVGGGGVPSDCLNFSANAVVTPYNIAACGMYGLDCYNDYHPLAISYGSILYPSYEDSYIFNVYEHFAFSQYVNQGSTTYTSTYPVTNDLQLTAGIRAAGPNGAGYYAGVMSEQVYLGQY